MEPEQNRLLSDVEPEPARVVSIREAGRIRLEKALSRPSKPLPDELLPLHLAPPLERERRCAHVLLVGYALWRQGGRSIIEAVREAAGDHFATAHEALNHMRRALFKVDLYAWERHPHRVRADVRRLFEKTLGRLAPHRGGWRTSQRPPRSA